MENKKRSSFTGKLGFVLAAAGSAVGLGNIWRFPYLAAKYGGGIFLLTYLVLVVTFGFTLMIAEIALGRKTGLSAIGAFASLNKKWKGLGTIAAIIPVMILPYYTVIAGWIAKYFFEYARGGAEVLAQDGYLDRFIAQPVEPIFWFVLFIGATFAIVMAGVNKGIEQCSKVMMPILIVLSLVIAVYVCCQPGALEGVKYYLMPDFSKFSIMTVVAAIGQLFYSMSLAMGIMVTYGSYMKKDVNMEASVGQIELFDTGVAFLAGLMIVPSVYVFSGGSAEKMNQGTGLMFDTLPKVFLSMPMSNLIGAAFFLMVIFAALTSTISLMETIMSIVQDKTGMSRAKAGWLTFALMLLIGVPTSLGFGPLSFISLNGMNLQGMLDFTANSILMPILALLTAIFIVWVVGVETVVDEVKLSSRFKKEKLFRFIIKYIVPVSMVTILVSSILDTFDIVSI